MLHDGSGNGDGTNGQITGERTGHTGVDNDIRMIRGNHGLGAHGGRHFADAADCSHDFLAVNGSGNKGNACNRFRSRVLNK